MITAAWKDRMTVAAPLAAVGLLAATNPTDDGPTLCPFALVTGVACPGCGLTRAVWSLVNGDLTTSIDYHPLAPMVLAALIGGWGWYLLRRSGRARPLPARWVNIAVLGGAVMFLGVWVA
ncbi:MAG TPA: DUF2752 domain-containing protein, partial [Acidimicrobiia bacterium]